MSITTELKNQMAAKAIRGGHTQASFEEALNDIIEGARCASDIRHDLIWFNFATEKMLAKAGA